MRSLALAALCTLVAGCAGTECNFSSQCERAMYCDNGHCLQDCVEDFDCAAGEQCTVIGRCVSAEDAGERDASVDPDGGDDEDGGVDVGVGRDVGVDGGADGDVRVDGGEGDAGLDVGVDAGGMGSRLDPCAADGVCMSSVCASDRCSVSCSGSGECADDEICAGGRCTLDDSGTPCSLARPDTCVAGLCFGSSTSGSGECTRGCGDASECHAGSACTVVSGVAICADIERPCARAADCATGLCLGATGCTAACRSARDCPLRATSLGVSAYTCELVDGVRVCVPPADIAGSDRLGASCPAFGGNTCRSGLCSTDSPGGPMCVQACTAAGGCPPGFGCKPEEITGGGIAFLCARAGPGAFGSACSAASQCATSLCDATGFCTRLCDDRICPSGYTCDPLPGTTSRICRRS